MNRCSGAWSVERSLTAPTKVHLHFVTIPNTINARDLRALRGAFTFVLRTPSIRRSVESVSVLIPLVVLQLIVILVVIPLTIVPVPLVPERWARRSQRRPVGTHAARPRLCFGGLYSPSAAGTTLGRWHPWRRQPPPCPLGWSVHRRPAACCCQFDHYHSNLGRSG